MKRKSLSNTATSQGSSGCGCGCGGASKECCDGHDCGGCNTGMSVRPRFFSGNLLTAEDLELLGSYLVEKTRIHNRYLHGSGVVCGLQVICHPCGEGRVIVEPGYALDCCGNDVLVPCKQELDVNAMIHRLRVEKLGGYDCGDPCDEPAVDAAGNPVTAGDKDGPRRYCLYLNYCEEATDPVAPYVTGEPCGQPPCEPTRIREGFSFELRCPEKGAEPDDVLHRIRDCIADLAGAEKSFSDANSYERLAARAEVANLAYQRNERPVFAAEDVSQLNSSTANVNAFVERYGSGNDTNRTAARKKKDQDSTEPDEPEVREALDDFQRAAALVVRYDLQDADARGQLGEEAAAVVANSRETVIGQAQTMATFLPRLSVARDTAFAKAVLDDGPRLVVVQDEETPLTQERLLFANGVAYNSAVRYSAARDLAAMREWLLCRVDEAKLTDCKLRDELQAIAVPADGGLDSAAFARIARQLLALLVRYLLDCICYALNPPCPPCDDRGVLLACLEVDDCEVCRICNLERTYVLSATAFRYWVPLFRWIGEVFEWLCCEASRRLAAPPKPKPDEPRFATARQLAQFEDSTPVYANIQDAEELPKVLRITGIDERNARSFVNLTGSLGRIAVRNEALTPPQLREIDLARPIDGIRSRTSGEIDSAQIMRVLASPQVRSAVESLVDARVRAVAPRAPTPEVVEVDTSALEPRVRAVERLTKSRLTATSLRESKPYKDLRGSIASLRDELRKSKRSERQLAARLEALEKGKSDG